MLIVKAAALLKHGQSNFSVLILEYVEPEFLSAPLLQGEGLEKLSMPWRYVYNYIRRNKNYVYIINNLYFLVSGKLLESHLFINEYSLSLYVFNMDFSDIYSFSVPVLTYLNTDTEKLSIIKDNKENQVYINELT